MTEGTATTAKKTTAKKTTTRVDVIATTVNKIENLDEKQTHKMLMDTIEGRESDAFKLGGLLSRVQREGWFKGYPSLKEYAATEFGIEYRKAMYYMAIYNDLNDSGVEWSQVKSLGWTKLSRLSKILTKENAAEWIEKATNMTVLALEQAIKGNSQSSAPADKEQPTSNTVSMTFKFHTDQQETVKEALAKAKAELQTDVDTVAIENICMGYLTGSVQAAPSEPKVSDEPMTLEALVAAFGKLTPDAVLEAFEKVWPHINMTVEE